MREFADLLRTYRNRWRDPAGKLSHLPQEEVSIRLGYSESTYGQWERGRGQPTERADLLKLIALFYSGQGLTTLTEANQLLHAGGYRDLYPQEIRTIAAGWLPEGEMTPQPLAENSGAGAVVTYVYERFPTETFCHSISRGQEIRILNTWIPNLSSFIEPLIAALHQGAQVSLLLLYPRSLVAELRNEAIKSSTRPVLTESVQGGVQGNLDILRYIAQNVSEAQRKNLQVQIYHSLPSVSIYQVDHFCLMGTYFHGQLAIESPQFEVNMTSFLGKRIDKEFNTLWSIAYPINDLEHWRLDLDLLAGKF